MEMSLFQLYCVLVSGKEGSNLVIHSMAVNVQSISCLLVFLVIVKCQREETVAVCGFPGIPADAEIVERNGRINVNTTFKENDVVEYQCRDGFRHFGTSRGRRICQQDGTWLGETIQCQEQIYCNSENLLQENRVSIYQCHFNRTVRISFIELEFFGYSREVSTTKGREREVICHHFSSSSPGDKKYKVLQLCNNVTTDQVEFRYMPSTSFDFSIFSSPTTKCDDYPSVPVNGIGFMKNNSFIDYKCKPGYQLHGSTFSRCDSQNGLWLPSLPQCRSELKMPPIQDTSTSTRYNVTSTASSSKDSVWTSSSTTRDTSSTKSTNQIEHSGDPESGIIIVMSCISLLILIVLVSLIIWFIKRKRSSLSKDRQLVAVLYNNEIAAEDDDDSCESQCENFIALAINPSPIYSQLDFQNPNHDLYAVVDKKKKIGNQVKIANIANNKMANTERSTEVIYTTIKPHVKPL